MNWKKEGLNVALIATSAQATSPQINAVINFLQTHVVDVLNHCDGKGAAEDIVHLFGEHGATIVANPPFQDKYRANIPSDQVHPGEHFMRRNARHD